MYRCLGLFTIAAQHTGQGLHIHTVGNRHRGKGMTEVMEPHKPKIPRKTNLQNFSYHIVPIIQTILFRYHCYCSVGGEIMSILKNAIQCKLCGDVIESTSVHDFKTCSCGACSVDGGHDYLRRCAKSLDDFVDLSEFQKQDVEAK